MKIQNDTKIASLIKRREEARSKGLFKEADQIRNSLEESGYKVKDEGKKSVVEKIEQKKSEPIIAIFGSGETTSVGRKIHDHVLSKKKKNKVKISIISTPAGFQPNVTTVHEEIANFFCEHLSNYHPSVTIIYANTKNEANSKSIVDGISGSDYIFIGPGSPTYAIKNLRDTLLLEKILEEFNKGASLGIASAAAIAFSSYSLPVYEIYKVGEPLFWEKGLNVFTKIFSEISIIPHFNNNEGGVKNDTSFCFMGEKRFKKLLEIVPANEEFLGIDENTAAVIEKSKLTTMGVGKIKLFNSTVFEG